MDTLQEFSAVTFAKDIIKMQEDIIMLTEQRDELRLMLLSSAFAGEGSVPKSYFKSKEYRNMFLKAFNEGLCFESCTGDDTNFKLVFIKRVYNVIEYIKSEEDLINILKKKL